ncbi:MAG: HK97 gp10 family phage protein [Defluviitaleaceae bacterium]|nr:HK97 gp10 family phage protein [Defluviitaleaceae bacterium]
MPKTRAKIDFGQFTKLKKQFEKLSADDMHEFSVAVVKDLAARLLAKVKRRTPVNKGLPNDVNYNGGGGRLRDSWTIGNVTKSGNIYSVEVINPMHYAIYVEKGHRGVYVPEVGVTLHLNSRWTDGIFMLKISEDELRKDAERIVENKLQKFFNNFKG